MSYSVNTVGDPRFPRFVIQDDERSFFSDMSRGGFTSDESKASLFATQAHADEKARQLRELDYLDRPIREFEVKATVRVSGNPDFGKAELLEFLKQAASVSINGDGPVSDSFLTLTMDWDSIRRGKQWLTD